MGKQTKAKQTASLWKFGKKWDGEMGWVFAGCSLVNPYNGPMFPRGAGLGIVESLKKTFGQSKHRGARIQRFRSRHR